MHLPLTQISAAHTILPCSLNSPSHMSIFPLEATSSWKIVLLTTSMHFLNQNSTPWEWNLHGLQRPLIIWFPLCCDNHLLQGQMITQAVNLLVGYQVGNSQENSTRSLCLISVLYIQNMLGPCYQYLTLP